MMASPSPLSDSLTPEQQQTLQALKVFLTERAFDKQQINPHLPGLVNQLSAVCRSFEEQKRMEATLYGIVRSRRLLGYWLTYLFQLAMKEQRSPYFVTACVLYSDAQINFNEDLLLSSLERGYNTQKDIPQADMADALRERIRFVYGYFREQYSPRPYTIVNPLTDHLYSAKTRKELAAAFPELNKPSAQITPDAYLQVIAQSGETGDRYWGIVARRFLGCLYQGQGDSVAALEQFRVGMQEAQSDGLDTEIGHFHRLYGYALRQTGNLQEAAQQFYQAFTFEEHPTCAYWQALSARELGDARMLQAFSEADGEHRIRKLGAALGAYRGGQMMFEANLGAGALPVARAVKQQMFRSYTDNAIQVAWRQSEQETLVEIEAAGPRYATELVAESRAAHSLSGADQERFRRGRAVTHQHLTTFNTNGQEQEDFDRYLASVEASCEERNFYLNTRNELVAPITHAQLSAEIVAKVVDLRLPNVAFLLFHIGQQQTWATLLDAGVGNIVNEPLGVGEVVWQATHVAYQQALTDIKNSGAPAALQSASMRDAIEAMLNGYNAILGPLLAKFAPFLQGRHLKIFPRLFMNDIPFHALTVEGKPLLELCQVSYAQTLGQFLQTHQPSAPLALPALAAIYQDKEMPFYEGALQALTQTYRDDMQILRNPSWKEFAKGLRSRNFTDLLFACHGVYDADYPANSYLKFGELGQTPFTKLFAELDLTGYECVTMGACESGIGRTLLTAEYLGLPIAFIAAGARYVVSALWKVDKVATAILLSHFYRLRRPTQTPGTDGGSVLSPLSVPAALNEAQRIVMRLTNDEVLAWLQTNVPDKAKLLETSIRALGETPYFHPYYWAGFYVAGDV